MTKKDDKKKSEDRETEKKTEKVQNRDTQLEELENKVAELENNWKRALADYQNLQKRTLEEKTAFVEFATATIFRKIIPVMDNLEMLNKHLKDDGIKMIVKEFEQVLADEEITELDPKGKKFDHTTMEAIEMIEGKKDEVLEVVQKGYLFKNKLLRPARVKVGKG